MAKRLYKYFSAEVLPLVFSTPGICSIKCSMPKDYNDPYELFLGVDLSMDTEALAYHAEVIGSVPQYPTTCFSRSPVVTPMWAHYAKNHTGFVVEFDEQRLKQHFEEIVIHDVSYRDGPSEALAERLQYAFVTKKPRHVAFFQQAVFFNAYFSKYSSWSYEQECRLLDQEGYSVERGGNLILDIPIDSCLAIISGANMIDDEQSFIKEIARSSDISAFHEIIGRSSGEPFFRTPDNTAFIFDGETIIPANAICQKCSEPIDAGMEYCPWCSVTRSHEELAARSNPMRVLDRYGMLEDYYKGFSAIGKSLKRTPRS